MGDFQFWLSVIIGIIYVLSRILKKNQAAEKEVPDNTRERRQSEARRQREVPQEQPMTFEDLLREITEGKMGRQSEQGPQSRPEPVRQQQRYSNYDEEVAEEEVQEVLEDVNYDYRTRDKLYREYEEAKQEAFERKSLEETMTLESTDMSYGKFKEFETQEKKHPMRQYLEGLHDPENLKKAFVVSEILQRKF
ncbi:MAG TPA: hypothetical protein VKZ68_06075 [Ohtaekwangia sp.]|nr:hypothetical protein [Ohtaekwangia sp.]